MKKSGVGILSVLGVLGMLVFSGCSHKEIPTSESTAKIIMDYSKKPTPLNWYWNFGIGKNYSSALEDASKALTFEQAVEVETKIISSSPETILTKQNGPSFRVGAYKLTNTVPKNKYNSENLCKFHKILNTLDGYLIIRICPDLQDFENIRTTDEYYGKVSHNAWNFKNYYERKFYKGEYSTKDKLYLDAFQKELIKLQNKEIWLNFPENDFKELESFALNEYKNWFDNLPVDFYIKEFYGIIYPYFYEVNPDTYKVVSTQYWKFTEYPFGKNSNSGKPLKVRLTKRLTPPEILGITDFPEIKGLTFIGNRGGF